MQHASLHTASQSSISKASLIGPPIDIIDMYGLNNDHEVVILTRSGRT